MHVNNFKQLLYYYIGQTNMEHTGKFILHKTAGRNIFQKNFEKNILKENILLYLHRVSNSNRYISI